MMDDHEIARQVALLRSGGKRRRLLRACAAGEGILRLEDDEIADAIESARQAATEGKISGFIPASGAATRMFAPLVGGVLPGARDLAMWESLGLPDDAPDPLVSATILAKYGDVPKGLVPFHRDPAWPGGYRTAFDEHLVELATFARDRGGRVRVEFTVSPEHAGAFRARLAAIEPHLARLGARPVVVLSVQDPATDTLALKDGEIARDPQGDPILRPGGHGALLANLQRGGGHFVALKNIDNVLPDSGRAIAVRWRSVIVGLLADLHQEAGVLLAGLPGTSEEASGFLRQLFHRDDPPEIGLRRPMRVCGMVKNDGQPGGGPFFVAGAAGPQIVEGAEVDTSDPDQQAIWKSSTHFNPVDMAVALRDPEGRPLDLARFADPAAAMVSRKGDLVILEHPGLWNGSMAGFNTLFIEIPREIFQPVKSVSDLLNAAHRGV